MRVTERTVPWRALAHSILIQILMGCTANRPELFVNRVKNLLGPAG